MLKGVVTPLLLICLTVPNTLAYSDGEMPLRPKTPDLSQSNAAYYRDKVLYPQWEREWNRNKTATDNNHLIREVKGSVQTQINEGNADLVKSAVARPIKNAADTTIRVMSKSTGATGKAVGTMYGITQGAIQNAKSGGDAPCKSAGECFEKTLYNGAKSALKQYGGANGALLYEGVQMGETTKVLIQDNKAYSEGMAILNGNMSTLNKLQAKTQSTMDDSLSKVQKMNSEVQAFDNLNSNPYAQIDQSSNTIKGYIQERQREDSERIRLREIARQQAEIERQQREAESLAEQEYQRNLAAQQQVEKAERAARRREAWGSAFGAILMGIGQGLESYSNSLPSESSYSSSFSSSSSGYARSTDSAADFQAKMAAIREKSQRDLAEIRELEEKQRAAIAENQRKNEILRVWVCNHAHYPHNSPDECGGKQKGGTYTNMYRYQLEAMKRQSGD